MPPGGQSPQLTQGIPASSTPLQSDAGQAGVENNLHTMSPEPPACPMHRSQWGQGNPETQQLGPSSKSRPSHPHTATPELLFICSCCVATADAQTSLSPESLSTFYVSVWLMGLGHCSRKLAPEQYTGFTYRRGSPSPAQPLAVKRQEQSPRLSTPSLRF